jgi:hypothetical protein
MSTAGTDYTEHHFRKVIPGNIEQVRQRLSDVLEDFDYIVISDNPLQAKRPARKNIWTSNILEYDNRLTVALKAISPASTLATFDYAVEYLFTKGERLTLEREADAIIALVNAPLNKTVCPACETENLGAVRFCRVCGTPMARNKLPAELEVMRLMGGLSGAEVEIVFGFVIAALTLLISVPMLIWGKSEIVKLGIGLLTLGLALGGYFAIYGMRRLHKTLNSATPAPQVSPDPHNLIAAQQPQAQQPQVLPPVPVSVTEGTTEFMKQPEAAINPAERPRDTDAME